MTSLIIKIMNYSFFFFNDTATTEIYTLSLHDALPICLLIILRMVDNLNPWKSRPLLHIFPLNRSEEHTSELQSHSDLVCRLLLEKKKTKGDRPHTEWPLASNLCKELVFLRGWICQEI